jgi:hypothetical protein
MKKRFIDQINMKNIGSSNMSEEFFDVVIYSFSENIEDLIYIIRPIIKSPILNCFLFYNNDNRDNMLFPYTILLSEVI